MPDDRYIDLVFENPPSHEPARFVEVEDAQGRSIRIGDWLKRPDGYWGLRLPDPRVTPLAPQDEPD